MVVHLYARLERRRMCIALYLDYGCTFSIIVSVPAIQLMARGGSQFPSFSHLLYCSGGLEHIYSNGT